MEGARIAGGRKPASGRPKLRIKQAPLISSSGDRDRSRQAHWRTLRPRVLRARV